MDGHDNPCITRESGESSETLNAGGHKMGLKRIFMVANFYFKPETEITVLRGKITKRELEGNFVTHFRCIKHSNTFLPHVHFKKEKWGQFLDGL